MSFRHYFRSMDPAARERFAVQVGATVGHLNNVAYGAKAASAALARQIEMESDGEVKRWDMRPADWFLIWPELVGKPGAPDGVKASQISADVH